MAASDHINSHQRDRTYVPSEAGVEGETHYPLVAYHGTSREAADAIMREGFLTSRWGVDGPGVYLTPNEDAARGYAMGHDNPAIVRTILHPRNPVTTRSYTKFLGPVREGVSLISARRSDIAEDSDVWESLGLYEPQPSRYLVTDPSSTTPLDVTYPERKHK